MIIAARVCDAFETCITVEADKSVTVNPADLTDDEILELGTDVANKVDDQECAEALSLLSQVVETVSMKASQLEKYSSDLCTMYSEVLAQCVQQVTSSLQVLFFMMKNYVNILTLFFDIPKFSAPVSNQDRKSLTSLSILLVI